MGVGSAINTQPYFSLNSTDSFQIQVPQKEKSNAFVPESMTKGDTFQAKTIKNSDAAVPFNSGINASVNLGKPSRTVEISNYEDGQGKALDLENFKRDVAIALDSSPANIEISHTVEGLKAKNLTSGELVALKFKDKNDFNRLSTYLNVQSTVNLTKFGEENAEVSKKIMITNYEDGLSRDSQIQLFKDDVARGMKAPIELIEIHLDGNNIIAYNIETKIKAKIEFDDNTDYERLLKYARQTKSRRLADFGIKKQELTIALGGSTKFPDNIKENTQVLQEINYSTFLGKDAKHRVKVDVRTEVNIVNPSIENIKDITLTYQNTDLPLTGTYGDIKVSYKEGKFSVGGKYEYLDLQADKFARKLKDKDPTAIAIAASALVIAAGGIYIAKDKLDEAKDIDIPLKVRVYSNGKVQVKAEIKPTLIVGGGKIGMDLSKAGIEVKQNIASGTDMREKIVYDISEKRLNSEFEANFDRAHVKITNDTFLEDSDRNKTHITIGKSHTVADGVNISYSYQQDFDKNMKPSNQSVNVGVEYTPNDNFRLNAGAGISLPKETGKLDFSATAKATYRF